MLKQGSRINAINGQLSRLITLCFTLPERSSIPDAIAKRVIVESTVCGRRSAWGSDSRDFANAMSLREAADYEAEFSEAGAKAVISSAEKFLEKATAILSGEK